MRPRTYEIGTELRIFWYDIKSSAAWQTEEEIENIRPPLIKTLGMFLRNKRKYLVICHNLMVSEDDDGDDTHSDVTVIPWGAIERIE